MGSLLNSLRSLPPLVLAIWAAAALVVIVAPAAQWSAFRLTLSARSPRLSASLSVLGPDGRLHSFGSLAVWGPHESADDFCLPHPYMGERSNDGLTLRIVRPCAEPLRAEFIR